MQPEQGQGAELPDGRANGQLAGKAITASQPAGQAAPLPGDPPQTGRGPATQSAPQPAGTAVPQPTGPGLPQSQPVEQKTFRLPGAVVAWWAWLIFAFACLVDILVSGRSHLAADIAVTLVFITGLVYACALWPRVVTDSTAITVRNPLRDHRCTASGSRAPSAGRSFTAGRCTPIGGTGCGSSFWPRATAGGCRARPSRPMA